MTITGHFTKMTNSNGRSSQYKLKKKKYLILLFLIYNLNGNVLTWTIKKLQKDFMKYSELRRVKYQNTSYYRS